MLECPGRPRKKAGHEDIRACPPVRLESGLGSGLRSGRAYGIAAVWGLRAGPGSVQSEQRGGWGVGGEGPRLLCGSQSRSIPFPPSPTLNAVLQERGEEPLEAIGYQLHKF